MKTRILERLLPSWKNALLAILAAVLLILAFPDFEFWFLAWFALVPLMWAIGREKASIARSFVVGWIFGTIFFFGTCWWLTFAPITYAGFSPVLAYFLLFCVTLAVGVFPALFAAVLSVLLKRFGSYAFLAAPFVWVFTEFLRYWVAGNNWNAIGYSQAFLNIFDGLPPIGGVSLVSFYLVLISASIMFSEKMWAGGMVFQRFVFILPGLIIVIPIWTSSVAYWNRPDPNREPPPEIAKVVAIQPNVPMSGLDPDKWQQLRGRQVGLAENAIRKINEQRSTNNDLPTTVILPESPMNFMYDDDPEFRTFINGFAVRNNISVLFNSAEPDRSNGKFFNSAVMIDSGGREIAEYDKIYLLPFGEAVPVPFEGIVPGFVGNFSYGRKYDLLPLGDAKAGVMICFESHFGQLSREYVRNGADAIIEMTNDGYLGPTPVLRQHLANAVFRAMETNRPVLRVTNVGITAHINERGQVLHPTAGYTEDTRVWPVSKSDGKQTFYVRYGDWFAWLCSVVTIGLLIFGAATRRRMVANGDKH